MMKYPCCYCVSCYSGEEEKVAAKIRNICGCYTLVPKYEREEKKKGIWTKRQHVFLPGYVFLYAERPLNFGLLYGISQLTGCLKYDDGFQLRGSDLEFAEWIWRYQGLIHLSQAIMEGERIKVIDGPLRDYEGVIKKVNKHRRSALVEITVGNHIRDVWMSFRWFDTSQQIQK